MALIFSDDLERAAGEFWLPTDDPPGPWTSYGKTSGGTMLVSVTDPLSGDASGYLDHAGLNVGANLRFDSVGNLAEAWSGMTVKAQTLTRGSADLFWVVCGFYTAGLARQLGAAIIRDTGPGATWHARYWEGSSKIFDSTIAIATGVSYVVEQHLVIGAGTGLFQVWIDGVLIINLTGLTNNGNTIDELYILQNSQAADQHVTGQWDDLQVATSRLYPPSYLYAHRRSARIIGANQI